MFLLLAAIIGFVIYIFARPNTKYRFDSSPRADAEDTLKKRFVSGEIDEETYLRMLKTIRY